MGLGCVEEEKKLAGESCPIVSNKTLAVILPSLKKNSSILLTEKTEVHHKYILSIINGK